MGYTDVDRRLGEKYRFHVNGENIHSDSDIDNATVDKARDYFTRLFGVRIYNQPDMDNLENSASAYMNGNKTNNAGQSDAAVARAVNLKKNYFPEALWKWNPDDAKQFPYVADIPAPDNQKPILATLASLQPPPVNSVDNTINNTIQGGTNTTAPAVDGIAPSTTTPPATTPVPASDAASWLETYWYIPVGVLVLGVVLIVVLHHKKEAS